MDVPTSRPYLAGLDSTKSQLLPLADRKAWKREYSDAWQGVGHAVGLAKCQIACQAGKTRWSHYNIAYHLVWLPKYRRKILTGSVETVVKQAIIDCCATHGYTLIALETDIDHVHCFISARPSEAPSKIVGLLKGYSSRMVRRRFPALARRTGRDQLWTSAYYVGTAGAMSAGVIRRYISECQGK